ncbi:MAG: triose-phosphate isomerase [Actinobacteria bacterium]|nr:triose-phosphate isomerase [Actinomycetota bacterium]
MRIPLIAGNWKMNLTHMEAIQFVQNFGYDFRRKKNCEICICPPFTALRSIKNIIDSDRLDLKIGAQNMHWEKSGAFTGEVSPEMLVALNIDYVIIGHSERRQYFAETNETVNKKVKSAFEFGLKPIICIGEELEVRQSGKANQFVLGQLVECLDGVQEKFIPDLTIAYEPIWAIGTGKTATSEDSNDMCFMIRKKIAGMYSDSGAEAVRILYGGSVKPSNISELMAMTDIDGVLVGGASIKVEDFIAIINY